MFQRSRTGEIKLYENSKERDLIESLAEFYSIIKTTDLLESAYSRDSIKDNEYSEACHRLILQFKEMEKVLIRSKAIVNAEQFYKDYNIDCVRAYERLIVTGVPATVLHSTKDTRNDGLIVAETTQAFITAMDALRLNQRAVDEIHPLITDVMSSLTKNTSLPSDFEGLLKMKGWLQKLNQMRAMDEIQEDEVRQLLFDLDSSYAAFHKHLQKMKSH